MALKDYYLILGVSRTETARGIQNAFRELVKQLRPDRVGPQGTATFQDLVEAYQVLSDPERRKAYRHHSAPDRNRSPEGASASQGLGLAAIRTADPRVAFWAARLLNYSTVLRRLAGTSAAELHRRRSAQRRAS